ncbi:MAG: hypothetical protein QOE26_3260 [Verrucomicrobiota bacterium]|jgi:hypothetical protein
MRRAIVLTLALFALAVVIGLAWRLPHLTKQSAAVSVTPGGTPSSTPLSLQSPNTPVDPAGLQKPGGPYVSSDPRWAIVREKDRSDHNWEWRMPINFYGRVVDQNGYPVSAAKIEFGWTDLSASGSSAQTTFSSADGTFSLQGRKGRVLEVDVSKDGFYKVRSERLKSFDYAGFWEANYYEADPARPVIFSLRRKGPGEILSVGETQPPVSADGTPVRLDLLDSGRASPTGQIEIAAVTNTEKYPPRRFDWRASITVHDGGLKEHDLEFPFEAPQDGYKPTIELVMPEGSPDWKRVVEKGYFIRFGNPPKYGRIYIRFNGAAQKAYLRYTINPTGSRNLERPTDERFSDP